MKAIFQSKYSNYFLAALLINIVAAWFSIGSHHPDEHYQIIEFANYKLGNTTANTLPWEFGPKMRPALQPFIAYGCMKAMFFMGIHNPFVIAFLFRLMMGVLIWFISCKLVLLFLADFKTDKGKQLFVLLGFFLWFVPYLSVRFSSENTASACFMAAIYLLVKPYSNSVKKNSSYVYIGCLLALSFFFRFQMAFALIGLAIWLLSFRQLSFKNGTVAVFSFLITCAVCVCIDKWFYNTWVFTPYNYYVENIVHHVAAGFGVEPWWYYFTMFIDAAAPPLSLVLACFFGIGLYKKRMHVFTFVLIAFVAGHTMVAHKEMRFLFPMVFAFVYLVAVGVDFYIPKMIDRKFFRISFIVLIVFNSALLLYRTFVPAQEAILFYKYTYDTFKKPTTIISVSESMYQYVATITFYRPKTVQEVIVKDTAELTNYLQNNKADSVIVFERNITTNFPASYNSKRIYCVYPDWVLHYTVGGWQDRANIWCMYQLTKK